MFLKKMTIKIVSLILLPSFLMTNISFADVLPSEKSALAIYSRIQLAGEKAKELEGEMSLLGRIRAGKRPGKADLTAIYGEDVGGEFLQKWVSRVAESAAAKWTGIIASLGEDFTTEDVREYYKTLFKTSFGPEFNDRRTEMLISAIGEEFARLKEQGAQGRASAPRPKGLGTEPSQGTRGSASGQALDDRVGFPLYRGATPEDIGVFVIGDGGHIRTELIGMIDRLNKEGRYPRKVAIMQPRGTATAEFLQSQEGAYQTVTKYPDGRQDESNTVTCVVSVGSFIDEKSTLVLRDETSRQAAIRYAGLDLDLIAISVTEAGVAKGSPAMLNLAEFLYNYFKHHGPEKGISIINTDNIPDNGNRIREYVTEFANERWNEAGFLKWLGEKAVFHNTMVDRIVVSPKKVQDPRQTPVAEPVPGLRMVVEDLGGVLPVPFAEIPGVIVCRKKGEIERYHSWKLRILNALHTAQVYVAALSGLDIVPESISHPVIGGYIRRLAAEIAPVIDAKLPIKGRSAAQFAEESIARFANPNVPHSTREIAKSGVYKIGVRFAETIADKEGNVTPEMAFAVAAVFRYLTPVRKTDKGYIGRNDPDTGQDDEYEFAESFDIVPATLMGMFGRTRAEVTAKVMEILGNAGLWGGRDLAAYETFANNVVDMYYRMVSGEAAMQVLATVPLIYTEEGPRFQAERIVRGEEYYIETVEEPQPWQGRGDELFNDTRKRGALSADSREANHLFTIGEIPYFNRANYPDDKSYEEALNLLLQPISLQILRQHNINPQTQPWLKNMCVSCVGVFRREFSKRNDVEFMAELRSRQNSHSCLLVKFIGDSKFYIFDRTVGQFRDLPEELLLGWYAPLYDGTNAAECPSFQQYESVYQAYRPGNFVLNTSSIWVCEPQAGASASALPASADKRASASGKAARIAGEDLDAAVFSPAFWDAERQATRDLREKPMHISEHPWARIVAEHRPDGTVTKINLATVHLPYILTGPRGKALMDETMRLAEEIRQRIRDAYGEGTELEYVIWPGMGGSIEAKYAAIATGAMGKRVRFFGLDDVNRDTLGAIIAEIIATEKDADSDLADEEALARGLKKTAVVVQALGMTSYEPVFNADNALKSLFRRYGLRLKAHFWKTTIDGSYVDKSLEGCERIPHQPDGMQTASGRHDFMTNGMLIPLILSGRSREELMAWIEAGKLGDEDKVRAKELAMWMVEAEERGLDKVVLGLPREWQAHFEALSHGVEWQDMTIWIKEHLEESLGKTRRIGLKVVTGDTALDAANYEPAGSPRNDKIFLIIRINGLTNVSDAKIAELRSAGYSVVVLSFSDTAAARQLKDGSILARVEQVINYANFYVARAWNLCAVDQPPVEFYKKIVDWMRFKAANFYAVLGRFAETPNQVARGGLTLNYDTMLRRGLFTADELRAEIKRRGLDESNPAHVAAAIHRIALSRPGGDNRPEIQNGEFTYYGDLSRTLDGKALREILMREGDEALWQATLKSFADVGKGPGMGHAYHAMIKAHQRTLTTSIIAREQGEVQALREYPEEYQWQHMLGNMLALAGYDVEAAAGQKLEEGRLIEAGNPGWVMSIVVDRNNEGARQALKGYLEELRGLLSTDQPWRAETARSSASGQAAGLEAPSYAPWLPEGPGGMIGTSQAMKRVFQTVKETAKKSPSVSMLILGKVGSGKSTMAKAFGDYEIIDVGSLRSVSGMDLNAVLVNSIKRANESGVLIIDDLHFANEDLKQALLRILQERSLSDLKTGERIDVKCRIVATATSTKGFGEQLTGRFKTVIEMPPISARDKDVVLLAEYFNWMLSDEYGIPWAPIQKALGRYLVEATTRRIQDDFRLDLGSEVRTIENMMRAVIQTRQKKIIGKIYRDREKWRMLDYSECWSPRLLTIADFSMALQQTNDATVQTLLKYIDLLRRNYVYGAYDEKRFLKGFESKLPYFNGLRVLVEGASSAAAGRSSASGTTWLTPEEATAQFNAIPTIGTLGSDEDGEISGLRGYYRRAKEEGYSQEKILEELGGELATMVDILKRTRPTDGLTRLLDSGITQTQIDVLRGASEFILQLIPPEFIAQLMPGVMDVDNVALLAKIKEVFVAYPEISKLLIRYFETKFNPDEEVHLRSEAAYEVRQRIEEALEATGGKDYYVLRLCLVMLMATVKTDYYLADRTGLFFRMDPKVIQTYDRKGVFGHAPPFAIIWVHVPYGAFGAHSRYANIARGGLRALVPERTYLLDGALAECRALSSTQDIKHTDICEGGSKGAFINRQGLNFVAAAIGYADGLINCKLNREGIESASATPQVDPLYLGPDENTGELTTLITVLGWMRGLPDWQVLITGKLGALGGISHMSNNLLTPPEEGNRVTAQGVLMHAVQMIRYLRDIGRIESKDGEPVKLSITGGMRGEVASGEVERAIHHLGDNAQVVCISDTSAVLFDPLGLAHQELLRLYHQGGRKAQCINFRKEELHRGGFVVETKKGASEECYVTLGPETLQYMNTRALEPESLEKSGAAARYRKEAKLGPEEPLVTVLARDDKGHPEKVKVHSVYLREVIFFLVRADLLLTGGGLMSSINDNNWEFFFDWDDRPTAPAIAHGANVFMTKNANRALEAKGVIIEPDEKANSVAVEISSRAEVDFNTLFNKEERVSQPDLLRMYFAQVLAKCLESARKKFWMLRVEAESHPGRSVVTEVSPRLSGEISRLAELIGASHLVSDRRSGYSEIVLFYLRGYFPDMSGIDKKYESTLDRVFERMSFERIRAIAAKVIARDVVLNLGIGAVAGIRKTTGKTAIEVIEAYLRVAEELGINAEIKKIVDNTESSPREQIEELKVIRERVRDAVSRNLAATSARASASGVPSGSITVRGHEYFYGQEGADKLRSANLPPAQLIRVVKEGGREYRLSRMECESILLNDLGYGLRRDPYHIGLWEVLYEYEIQEKQEEQGRQSRASASGVTVEEATRDLEALMRQATMHRVIKDSAVQLSGIAIVMKKGLADISKEGKGAGIALALDQGYGTNGYPGMRREIRDLFAKGEGLYEVEDQAALISKVNELRSRGLKVIILDDGSLESDTLEYGEIQGKPGEDYCAVSLEKIRELAAAEIPFINLNAMAMMGVGVITSDMTLFQTWYKIFTGEEAPSDLIGKIAQRALWVIKAMPRIVKLSVEEFKAREELRRLFAVAA